jgi:4-oxalocrotonate tautomerase
MPHLKLKLYPGKSEEQKNKLTEKIIASMKEVLGSSDDSISIDIEEVDPANWKEVYKAEIEPQMEKLYKKPGYTLK